MRQQQADAQSALLGGKQNAERNRYACFKEKAIVSELAAASRATRERRGASAALPLIVPSERLA
jgi:hypothetical protein